MSGFLRKARDMDNYGTAFHDVKYKDGHCRIGISPNGLSLYQRSRRLEYYDWMKMVEVSFKGKKLTVIVKDEKVITCPYAEIGACFRQSVTD